MITEIREKEVISEHATVGIYYFQKGSDFVENAIDMFAKFLKQEGVKVV